MVRTADSSVRTGGKASRKGPSASTSNGSRSRSPSNSSGDRSAGGLNPICPRETPSWQKPITAFFNSSDRSPDCHKKNSQNKAGFSKSSLEDVNMTEAGADCQTSKHIQLNRVSANEAMEEEINQENSNHDSNEYNTEDKENSSPNERSSLKNVPHNKIQHFIDVEMNEVGETSTKRASPENDDDDCDEPVAPRKKIKLDKNMYQHLETLEQAEY